MALDRATPSKKPIRSKLLHCKVYIDKLTDKHICEYEHENKDGSKELKTYVEVDEKKKLEGSFGQIYIAENKKNKEDKIVIKKPKIPDVLPLFDKKAKIYEKLPDQKELSILIEAADCAYFYLISDEKIGPVNEKMAKRIKIKQAKIILDIASKLSPGQSLDFHTLLSEILQKEEKLHNEKLINNKNNLLYILFYLAETLLIKTKYSFAHASIANRMYGGIGAFSGDLTKKDGDIYYVMKYVEGKTLNQIFDSESITWDDFFKMEIAVGNELLRAKDEKGIIHFDFSPNNVILKKIGDSYRAELIDFDNVRFNSPGELPPGVRLNHHPKNRDAKNDQIPGHSYWYWLRDLYKRCKSKIPPLISFLEEEFEKAIEEEFKKPIEELLSLDRMINVIEAIYRDYLILEKCKRLTDDEKCNPEENIFPLRRIVNNTEKLVIYLETIPEENRLRFLSLFLGDPYSVTMIRMIYNFEKIIAVLNKIDQKSRLHFLSNVIGLDNLKTLIENGNQLVEIINSISQEQRIEFIKIIIRSTPDYFILKINDYQKFKKLFLQISNKEKNEFLWLFSSWYLQEVINSYDKLYGLLKTIPGDMRPRFLSHFDINYLREIISTPDYLGRVLKRLPSENTDQHDFIFRLGFPYFKDRIGSVEKLNECLSALLLDNQFNILPSQQHALLKNIASLIFRELNHEKTLAFIDTYKSDKVLYRKFLKGYLEVYRDFRQKGPDYTSFAGRLFSHCRNDKIKAADALLKALQQPADAKKCYLTPKQKGALGEGQLGGIYSRLANKR